MLTIHPGASLREQARRPRGLRRSDIFLDLAALSEEEGMGSTEIASARKPKPAQGRAIGAGKLTQSFDSRSIRGVNTCFS